MRTQWTAMWREQWSWSVAQRRQVGAPWAPSTRVLLRLPLLRSIARLMQALLGPGVKIRTAGRLRPEEVGAHVLRHLLAAAEADLGAPIRRAVISASVWHAEVHRWHVTKPLSSALPSERHMPLNHPLVWSFLRFPHTSTQRSGMQQSQPASSLAWTRSA